MNYKPLGNRLIVRILQAKAVVIAGLEIMIAKPHSKEWSEEVLWAEVVRKGDGVFDVEEGDTVVIAGHAGKWMDVDLHDGDSHTHRIITEDEILAVDETAKVEIAKEGAIHA